MINFTYKGKYSPKTNSQSRTPKKETTKRTERTASVVAYDLTTQKPHKVERTQAHTDRMILNWIGDLCAFLYRMRIFQKGGAENSYVRSEPLNILRKEECTPKNSNFLTKQS